MGKLAGKLADKLADKLVGKLADKLADKLAGTDRVHTRVRVARRVRGPWPAGVGGDKRRGLPGSGSKQAGTGRTSACKFAGQGAR